MNYNSFKTKIASLILFLIVLNSFAFAQQGKSDVKRMFDQADLYLDAEEYHQALTLFLAVD